MKKNGPNIRNSKKWLHGIIRRYGLMLVDNPDSYVFISMARTALKAGEKKLALRIVNEGLNRRPKLLSAIVLKARILAEMKKIDEAETILEPVIEKEPDNLLARIIMAEICLEKKESQKGLEHIERVRETAPNKKPYQALFEKLMENVRLHPAKDDEAKIKKILPNKNAKENVEKQEERAKPVRSVTVAPTMEAEPVSDASLKEEAAPKTRTPEKKLSVLPRFELAESGDAEEMPSVALATEHPEESPKRKKIISRLEHWLENAVKMEKNLQTGSN